ncbi:apolipoprotein N-acyltransferase [Treponema denticola]|uniref:Apolipoprotein N-acyltransferase n=1 Tax=Treponema denticola SP33 TaxID=999437 RepID=M2BJD6_TREDN|nr:apolipoprotein N-acyltransferase [Treponema denticola]EMB22089.1 apolipoprotein N-acyltransferase 1 [Treponema denticola SP33]EPF35790.1 apolipoprotein N-acyltransferase 1 [Treponema denticola SP32]
MKNKFIFFSLNLLLAVLGAVLFSLSHPNYLNLNGLPILAYIALIPFFLLLKRTKLKFSFLWGAFSGSLSYFIFNFWIIFFHPLAIYIIIAKYCIFYSVLFFVLKIIDSYFSRYSFIFQAIAWVAFEYLSTLGFLGYPYGIIGYTQWRFTLLIRAASIFGVWGISFLLIFFSACTASFLFEFYKEKDIKNVYKIYRLPMMIWIGTFFAFILYGAFTKIDLSEAQRTKIALVQPNRDPWLGNLEVYRNNYEELKNLSEKALKNFPDIELVVWPETAFIPMIRWHYKYTSTSNPNSLLVRELLHFLDNQKVPFLIGNDNGVLDEKFSDNNFDNLEEKRLDYNAALLFIPKKNVLPPEPQTYRKMHLVPFTEHFPYQELFPRLYEFLKENDTHFWEKGKEANLLEFKNLKIGTPICFEDSFGYISKAFSRRGANIIINLTNDAWANSAVSQYQHLSMAVFRAVENRLPVLRAASSGQTVFIDQNGKIQNMLAPFVKDVLIVDVPVLTDGRQTVYSYLGDFFALTCSVFLVGLLCFIIINKFIKDRRLNETK